MELFKNDTRQIQLNFGSDLTASDTVVILYEKPSGEEGSWTASASTTYAVYTLSATDLDEVGKWYLRIQETTGGTTTNGKYERVQVQNEIV